MMSRTRTAQPIYEPMQSFVVRAPLLPIERYLALADTPDTTGPAIDLAKDSLVRAAIEVASPALLAELEHPPRSPRKAAALNSALLRYLIRMSTRPTPYGLFAGLGVGTWNAATDLRIDDGPRTVRVRPDMGWLTRVVLDLERSSVLDGQLRLVRNPCAFERDGRLHLSDRTTAGHVGQPDVSIRVTPVVKRVLAHARTPIRHSELVSEVLALTPGAALEQVRRLVGELCALGLLLSDLRPPLTGDPVRYVMSRLTGTDGGKMVARRMAGVMRQAALAERDLAHAEPGNTAALSTLRARIRAAYPVDMPRDDDVIQADSGLPLAGRSLSGQVGDDAAVAVELLLRMHPAPGGPKHLAGYRSAFVARYGARRQVPLMELLDPRFGLGPPGNGHARPASGGQQPAARRSERLFHLAVTALRDGQTEIVLGEDDVEELSTWQPVPDQLPPSLELSAFLLARSAEAVDGGEYTLVVGPNLGAQAAGRGLGRFADVVGSPACDLLRDIAAAEDARREADTGSTLAAELVYLPARYRSANVMVRPALRDHEIAIGVGPGVPPGQAIPAHELAVWVGDGRLRLWWTAGGCEVRVSAGHMLNPAGSPSVCRFLHEIGLDGVTPLMSFDWGQAGMLPALPRVRVGRVVLRPAQWRQPTARLAADLRIEDTEAFGSALRQWRRQWRVPQHVYLSAGDNRLLLDLDDPAQAGQLREELRRGHRRDLTLHEALPGPDDAWLPGPRGRYASELVIPLVLRASRRREPPALAARAVELPAPASTAVDNADRTRLPGSDWLYFILAGPRIGEDELIAGPLREFASTLVADGHAADWFFVRYADPDRQLRLRLHGEPAALMTQALPAAMTWAAGLIAAGRLSRVGLAVYDREVERYGGPSGISLAELVFAADSIAVAAMLAEPRGALDLVEMAVLSVDHLLAGLGLDEAARLRWYRDAAPPPVESGTAYRQRGRRLRELLGHPGADPASAALLDILARRTAELAPIGARLNDLADAGQLNSPVTTIARSLVHLHCNRLGVDSANERVLLGLLQRTRVSLVAAPLP